MKSIWIILVRYEGTKEVNTNEGYKTYQEAKTAIYKKNNNIEAFRTIDDFNIIDIEKDIQYELKCISIY